MKIALLSALFLIIITLILYIPLRLEIIYDSEPGKNQAKIKYMFFTFYLYPKKSKKNHTKDKDKNEEKNKKDERKNKEEISFDKEKKRIENYITVFNKIKGDTVKILRYAAQRAVVFEKIGVKIHFGFDDAMHTGIFTGILNGFVYSVLAVIHQNSTLKDMDVAILPNFEETCFDSHCECILHIRNVHIIIIAFNVLKIYKKIQKEGR